MGRRFPKGIPVATVTQVIKKDFGVYQEVMARPAVDFSRLEEVLIVLSAPIGELTPAASASAPPGR
jgi:rod shape-determining protein MreC